MQQHNNRHAITRLTALWALSESGLGGMMHALKIPFTGFFLGGFAIVIITLIAHNSKLRFKEILQATLLVILIKAAASPHSPPMAYIAVAFQGLMGAIFFSTVPFYRLAAMLFGMIALFESAVQKFLVSTLIFGQSIWKALDLFFQNILKDLSLPSDFSFSFWLITIYTGIYTLWGLLLGWWASSLPLKIDHRKSNVLLQWKELQTQAGEQSGTQKKKRKHKWISAFFVLLFIVCVFVFQGSLSKALYAIVRTVAALLLMFWVITPLLTWAIRRWTTKQQGANAAQVKAIADLLPELKNYLSPAMTLAHKQYKGLLRYKAFVFNLLVISLYAGDDENAAGF